MDGKEAAYRLKDQVFLDRSVDGKGCEVFLVPVILCFAAGKLVMKPSGYNNYFSVVFQ